MAHEDNPELLLSDSKLGLPAQLHAWNIAVGQFFFRYRNAIFPVIFSLVVPLALRPRVLFGDPAADRAVVLAGMAVALAGGAVRFVTIGFEYIDRGGKNKQVWASRLVQTGVYGVVRNPMYVGNTLIAVGMCMAAGSPAVYAFILPFFLFVYQAIIAAEEAYLLGKFGKEYAAYCARVPSFLPSFRGFRASFKGMRFNWRKSARKDLGTITGLLVAMSLLPLWRTYFLHGAEAAKADAPAVAALVAGILALYAYLHHLKKRRRFFYSELD